MFKIRVVALLMLMLIVLSTIQINVFAEIVEGFEEEVISTLDEESEETVKIIDISIEEGLQEGDEIVVEQDNIEIIYDEEREEVKELEQYEEEIDNKETELVEQPLECEILENNITNEISDRIISSETIKIPSYLQVKDSYIEVINFGYVIENLSEYPVLLKGLFINSQNNWVLSDFYTDYKNKGFNSKIYGLRVENHNVNNDYLDLEGEGIIIESGSNNELDIELKVAKQINGVNEVVFKIKVDLVPILPEVIVEENLQELEEDKNLEEVIEIDLEEDIENEIEEKVEQDNQEELIIEEKLDANLYFEALDYILLKVNEGIDYLSNREVITQQAVDFYSKELKDNKIIFEFIKGDIEKVADKFYEQDLAEIYKVISTLEYFLSNFEWLLVSTPVGEEVIKETEGEIVDSEDEFAESEELEQQEKFVESEQEEQSEQPQEEIEESEGLSELEGINEEQEIEENQVDEFEEILKVEEEIIEPDKVEEAIIEPDKVEEVNEVIESEIMRGNEQEEQYTEVINEKSLIQEINEIEDIEQLIIVESEEVVKNIKKVEVNEVILFYKEDE